MLKDRRVLIEYEIARKTKICGDMYLAAMRSGEPFTEDEDNLYQFHLEELVKTKTELEIINEMIRSGHE